MERCPMPKRYTITPLSELPLRSDFMFGQVMRSEEICRLFLEALLSIEIQRIEFLDRQKEMDDSYEYHGIRLDVYLKDEKGTVFNVEIQADRRDDLPRRVRFYQSGIDRSELPKGADYASLSESYIIFICDFDCFHIGKAVGERVSFLKDTNVPYEDGSHVYFLNSRYTETNASKPILEFLDLIRTNDVEKLYETLLAQMARDRMQEVRSDKELEVSYMTYAQKMMDERRVGYMDGLSEGREEGFKDTIIALKDILDPAVIAERFKMSLEQVMDILGQK
jgi:predicted transposase/invertase (TIGR01784 family)